MKNKSGKTAKKTLAFFLLFLFAATIQNIAAQSDRAELTIKIDQIISHNFPNVTLYAIVKNERGEVVSGLSPGVFRFRIGGMEETGRSSIIPFSMREPPIDYSIIISNSGIMEGEPLDFQRNAILQFVDAMKPRDTLSLYTIGEEANVIFEELRRDAIDPSVINSIDVTTVQPRLHDSVINVVRRSQRRSTERRVVIVISDGRDINSRFTKEQLNAVLQEAQIPVYTLGVRILGTQFLSNLDEMASLTGGTYLFTPQVSGIPASLRSLNNIITQPYIINLRVRSMRADDLPHILEVSINENDFGGRGQRTFIAVRIPVPQWARFLIAGAILLLIVVLVVLAIVRRVLKRKHMGITRRRCTDCRTRMRDTWDTCPFCRYLPGRKKKAPKEKLSA